MAQDITIAGAAYPEVPAITVPKTEGGTALFVDTSTDTVSEEDVAEGVTFHDATGAQKVGTGGKVYSVGTSAPENTKLLWIDTTSGTGGLKYYDGSAWKHVPVAFT